MRPMSGGLESHNSLSEISGTVQTSSATGFGVTTCAKPHAPAPSSTPTSNTAGTTNRMRTSLSPRLDVGAAFRTEVRRLFLPTPAVEPVGGLDGGQNAHDPWRLSKSRADAPCASDEAFALRALCDDARVPGRIGRYGRDPVGERTPSEGFDRATTLGDYPGWEKRDTSDRPGKVGVIVGPARARRPSDP